MIHQAGHDLMLLLVSYGYWAVLVIVGMESLGVPLPGETTLVAAAIYAGASHRLSIGLVILAAIRGSHPRRQHRLRDRALGGYCLLVRFGHPVRLHEPDPRVP